MTHDTGPNREAQIAEVQAGLQREVAAWIASGYPAAAVIAALVQTAGKMRGE